MKRSKSHMDIIMNPTRNRIIQYLISHGQATTSEIALKLSDIPKATLYRHMNVLVKNKILLVVEEHKIRGTVESVYTLNRAMMNGTGDSWIFFDTVSLNLSDEEYDAMIAEMRALVERFRGESSAKHKKDRKLTIISSPGNKKF